MKPVPPNGLGSAIGGEPAAADALVPAAAGASATWACAADPQTSTVTSSMRAERAEHRRSMEDCGARAAISDRSLKVKPNQVRLVVAGLFRLTLVQL